METLVSNSLTDSCLVNLIDVSLVCEDAYSKLVPGVSGNSLLPYLVWSENLTFVQTLSTLVKILKLKFRRDLKLKFGQYFAADVWLRLRR